MAEVFDTPAFNLMIAADKFQVGFDQPYLTTMFVDKTLRDVEAVQTFSRLNRVIPGVEKHTHILDFVNSRETISEAFSGYYAGTKTEEGYDPNYIYERRAELEAMDVVLNEQVIMFGSKFKSTDKDALKKLSGLLEPARQRYGLLSEDDQDRFRKSAKSLVNQYNSVTVANNFIDPYFADLVNYLHYLLMVLPKRPQDPMPEIEKVISLDHYRLIYAGGGTIGVSNGDPIANPGPGKISGAPVPDLLSEVVRKMNLRWGLSDFNDNDKIEMLNNVAKEVITEISKTSDIAEYADWTNEAFKKQFHTMAKTRLLTRAMENGEFVEVLLNSTDALDEVTSNILDVVHMRSMSSKSESDGMN